MATVPSQRTVKRPARLGPRAAGMSMSTEEFDALPASAWDDRYRYELSNGILVVTPSPAPGERGPNEDLGYLLLNYLMTHAQGASLDATLPEQTIVVGDRRRRADRAIWAGLGRMPDPASDVPTIVVEFVSRARAEAFRDYVRKRDEYMAADVKEYWIIDRFRRIMTVHASGPAGATTRVVAEAETYRTDLLPGFEIPLARLLSRADLWNRPSSRPSRSRKPTAGGADG